MTAYNWYNRHFHVLQFFSIPSKINFQLYSLVSRDSKFHNSASFLFLLLLIVIRSKIKWFLKIPEEFVRLILQNRFCFGCVYTIFFCMVKFQFLAPFPVDYLPLYSLIMCLIISSLSPHNLYLLFCFVLSILALIWLVLMALFCAAIRRNSVSLLRFPFISYVHVFLCEISLFSRLKRPLSGFSCHFCSPGISVLLILCRQNCF